MAHLRHALKPPITVVALGRSDFAVPVLLFFLVAYTVANTVANTVVSSLVDRIGVGSRRALNRLPPVRFHDLGEGSTFCLGMRRFSPWSRVSVRPQKSCLVVST
jgi:hypothetical protein